MPLAEGKALHLTHNYPRGVASAAPIPTAGAAFFPRGQDGVTGEVPGGVTDWPVAINVSGGPVSAFYLNRVFPNYAEGAEMYTGGETYADVIDPNVGIWFYRPGESEPVPQSATYTLCRWPAPLNGHPAGCWAIAYVDWVPAGGGGWNGTWVVVWYNPDDTAEYPPSTGWLTYPADAAAGFTLSYDNTMNLSYDVAGAGYGTVDGRFNYHGTYVTATPNGSVLKVCVWRHADYATNGVVMAAGSYATLTWHIFEDATPTLAYYYAEADRPAGATWNRFSWADPVPTVTVA